MPAGVGNLARPELLIVVFSLMADSQNGNRLSILDFEQCHVACQAKWDDGFAEKRIGILSLATGERKFLKMYRICDALCSCVPLSASAYIEKPANNPARRWLQPLNFGAIFPAMDNLRGL